MLTDDTPSTAPFLVGLQGDLFAVIDGGSIVKVVVAALNANEENREGRSRGSENS